MMAPPSSPTLPPNGKLRLENKKKIKQRLDPKCWKGYRKAGTKIKGGVRVNKCVKLEEALEKEITRLIKILENK